VEDLIRVSKLKSFLWFSAIILMALSFVIQVKFMSEWPSLWPYLIIGGVLLLPSYRPVDLSKDWKPPRRMEHLIGFYLVLVVFHASWQLLFGFISPYQAGRAIFIYFVPVIFYWYFSRRASLAEIRAVFIAIFITALVCGLFHAYDNVLRFSTGRVLQFSKDANAYSISRLQANEKTKLPSMRAVPTYRSFGLFQTHSTSATWTAFGAFAALALLPKNRRLARFGVIMIFAFLQLIELTFTSIVAFWITLSAIEYHFLTIIKARLPKGAFSTFVMTGFIVLIFFLSIPLIFDNAVISYITQFFTGQIELMTIGRGGVRFIDLIIDYAIKYVHSLFDFPLSLLIGDGSAPFGMTKGGDIGYIETLSRLGAPLFLGVVIGLTTIVLKIHKTELKTREVDLPLNPRSILLFSASVILFLMIMEIHYSVWSRKCVLPILFFALGLYARYRKPFSVSQTSALEPNQAENKL